MNCEEFRFHVVHALLGKASLREIDDCRVHMRACPACNQEAQATSFVIDLLKQAKVPPTSEAFRRKLMERFQAEIAAEATAEERVSPFSWSERFEAQFAWVGYRFRRSPGLRMLAAAAAVLFGIVLFGYAASGLREPKVEPSESFDAYAPIPIELKFERIPTPPPSVAEADRNDARLETNIEPAPNVQPPEIADPELQRQRNEVEAENQWKLYRFEMRSRFEARLATAEPRNEMDRAVLSALRFLVDQQNADGSFDPGEFQGQAALRPGITGLATLALLSNAERGVPGGKYKEAVGKAVRFLRHSADKDGTIGRVVGLGERDYEYTLFNHAVAVAALAEHAAVAGTGRTDALLRDALLKLSDLSRQRESDTLVVTDATTAPWVAYAFDLSRRAGIVPDFDLARASATAQSFVRSLVAPGALERGITVAAQVGPWATSYALSTEGGVSANETAPPLPLLLDHLRRAELREPSRIFFATLEMRRRGGDEWERWQKEATQTFLATHAKDGAWSSSYQWDWISDGGSDLYTTALAILTLSVEPRPTR